MRVCVIVKGVYVFVPYSSTLVLCDLYDVTYHGAHDCVMTSNNLTSLKTPHKPNHKPSHSKISSAVVGKFLQNLTMRPFMANGSDTPVFF